MALKLRIFSIGFTVGHQIDNRSGFLGLSSRELTVRLCSKIIKNYNQLNKMLSKLIKSKIVLGIGFMHIKVKDIY